MQYASVLLFNAVILTLDGSDAVASALALDGDRILAVGDRDGLAPLIGPDTECRDMGGAAVLPGFYDAHGHILMAAQLPAASMIRCWRKNGSPAVGNWMRRPRIIPCSHSIFPGICAF